MKKNLILETFYFHNPNQIQYLCPRIGESECLSQQLIAGADNFNPGDKLKEPPLPPKSNTSPNIPSDTSEVTPSDTSEIAPSNTPEVTPSNVPEVTPSNIPKVTPAKIPVQSFTLNDKDKTAAKIAWKYFERNWNPRTGLVNSSDNIYWTTWWDQGSALMGIHAAKQLGLLPDNLFKQRMNALLNTLEKLPLPKTGLPNKAYTTNTVQMHRLNNTPDIEGKSGWSALDISRFLLALHIMRSHYPEYTGRINTVVARWNLQKLVKNGWLNGSVSGKNNTIFEVQEGRFGYEQYAAMSLKFWNIHAENALNNPPIQEVKVDGITLQVDQREYKNSGATNYLTNDPYLLWGLEIGWNDKIKNQVKNIFKVQSQRYYQKGILTAVNEDSLDRHPYFIYYSIYANGKIWNATNSTGKSYPNFRVVSTKAGFSWFALMPNEEYSQKLRQFVQNLGDNNRGYFSGKYENSNLGINKSIDVNTNAIILESILYRQKQKPLVRKND